MLVTNLIDQQGGNNLYEIIQYKESIILQAQIYQLLL